MTTWRLDLEAGTFSRQRDGVLACLGESPEAMRGAVVIIRHLYSFMHDVERMPVDSPDGEEIPDDVVYACVGWAAGQWLEFVGERVMELSPAGKSCTPGGH